jgi:hypothetical protein
MGRLLTRPEVSLALRIGPRSGRADFTAAALAMVAPAGALAWVLPMPLVLPALSLLLMAAAGVAALVAITTGCDRNSAVFSAWDSAGLLFFAGCCAAMLSETAQLVAILEDAQLAHQTDPFPRDPPN